ncbi:MAG: outer membrane beta-barrel protein, partial [Bacteroidota bacterium]
MKKKELNIIFLFLVIPFLSFAQKKFVSFKMGPMFSQANAKPPATLIAGFEDQPFLGHINVGASISRINLLNKKWGIEWGLAYYNIGYKEKEVPFTADLKRRAIFNSQYFSLPFSIKYFLKEQQRAAIYLGHAFSWMAAQKREVARISNIGTSVNEYKNADAYHRLNYFVFIGANWIFGQLPFFVPP